MDGDGLPVAARPPQRRLGREAGAVEPAHHPALVAQPGRELAEDAHPQLAPDRRHDDLIGQRAIDGQVAGRLGRQVAEPDGDDQQTGAQPELTERRDLHQRLLHARGAVLDLDRGGHAEPVARTVLDREHDQRQLGGDVRLAVDEHLPDRRPPPCCGGRSHRAAAARRRGAAAGAAESGGPGPTGAATVGQGTGPIGSGGGAGGAGRGAGAGAGGVPAGGFSVVGGSGSSGSSGGAAAGAARGGAAAGGGAAGGCAGGDGADRRIVEILDGRREGGAGATHRPTASATVARTLRVDLRCTQLEYPDARWPS